MAGGDAVLPSEVSERDRSLQGEAEQSSQALAWLRWQWTLSDDTRPRANDPPRPPLDERKPPPSSCHRPEDNQLADRTNNRHNDPHPGGNRPSPNPPLQWRTNRMTTDTAPAEQDDPNSADGANIPDTRRGRFRVAFPNGWVDGYQDGSAYANAVAARIAAGRPLP